MSKNFLENCFEKTSLLFQLYIETYEWFLETDWNSLSKETVPGSTGRFPEKFYIQINNFTCVALRDVFGCCTRYCCFTSIIKSSKASL